MTCHDSSSAWFNAMTALGNAGDRFVAEMQERGQSVERDDVVKSMLGALMNMYLTQIAVDTDNPVFVPCTGYFQRLGSPNPDTVYRGAPIDPSGTYRLSGERGSARDVTIMPFTQAMRGIRPFDLTDVATGSDGAFDVVLSAERPAGFGGDWWQLHPDTASLWLREVSDRWGHERAARISIVRLDSVERPRPKPEQMEQQLAQLASSVERIIDYGIRHVDDLVRDGYVGRLKQIDYSATGAMPLQFYHEGIFDLQDDECLLIECRMDVDCKYFSWSITDSMLVTLDWMNACTSLNTSQAVFDRDGVLRVIVSRNDPGTPNWMETLGYRFGVMQLRSIGSEKPPIFNVRVVALDAVFDHLPAETPRIGPETRAARLEERKRGWQLRRLW
jgi:hypothetical protein